MNDAGFQVFVVVALGAILFFLSPRAFRHWSVLLFVVLVFLISLTGVPYKLTIFAATALVIWIAGIFIDRSA